MTKTDDGGYLVGGTFDKYQTYTINNIAKIDSNGIVEPQHFAGIGPDSSNSPIGSSFVYVSKILKSKFGGYYVAGDFLKWDGQPSQPIVRIHGLNTLVGVTKAPLGSARGAFVVVYPNPTTGVFRVESDQNIEMIEIYNLSGSRYNFKRASRYNSANAVPLDDLSKSLDLTNFPNGIYFLKVELENGAVVTKKVVKSGK
jgi:hypothetical protein